MLFVCFQQYSFTHHIDFNLVFNNEHLIARQTELVILFPFRCCLLIALQHTYYHEQNWLYIQILARICVGVIKIAPLIKTTRPNKKETHDGCFLFCGCCCCCSRNSKCGEITSNIMFFFINSKKPAIWLWTAYFHLIISKHKTCPTKTIFELVLLYKSLFAKYIVWVYLWNNERNI